MRLPDLNIRRIFDSLRSSSSVDPEQEPPKKKRKADPIKTFIIDSIVVVLLLSALFYIGSIRSVKAPMRPDQDLLVASPAKQKKSAPVKTEPQPKPSPPVKSASPAPVKTEPQPKPSPPVKSASPAPVKTEPQPKPSPPAKRKEAPNVEQAPRVIPVIPPVKKTEPQVKPAPKAEPIKPIVSRPVAKDLPKESRKTSKQKKVYKIRFAVCQLAESCQEVQSHLFAKGIKTSLEKTVHNLMTHHVAVGPLPTRSHAQKAGEDLEKLGVKSSLLVSGDRYFMITKPEYSLARARKTLSITTKAGFKGKVFSRKETQDMYKVYGQSLKTQEEATRIRNQYKTKGIDCIVED